MSIRSTRYSFIAAAFVLGVAAAACGDDDDSAGTAAPGVETTAAGPGVTTAGTGATTVGGTQGTTAGTEGTTAGTEATTAGSITMGSVPEDFSIVYVPGLTGNPFYNTVACGAQKKAEELGIDFKYQGAPEFDVAAQSAIVSALVGDKPDAIMISVTDQDAMIPPLTEAKDAGITLIGIDGDLSDKSILSTNIQSDNLVGGALAAESLVQAVGEDVGGDVIGISNDAGNPIGEAREKGFTDELSKYPGFNYLGTQYSQNAQAKAATIVSTTASSNDKLVGVYTMATNNTEGAVTGLREAGKTSDEVHIVGYDVSEPILEALEAGDITGLVVQYPYGAGQLGVESAVAVANGQEVPHDQPTKFVFATPENLKTDEVQQFIYKLECD
jgi:ribose transport system substrate-binding protein